MKVLQFLLTGVMAACLCACGSGGGTDSPAAPPVKTVTAEVVMHDPAGGPESLSITADGDSIYECHYSDDYSSLVLGVSHNKGQSWVIKPIATGRFPAISVKDGVIRVVWANTLWRTLWISKSTDDGSTWTHTSIDSSIESDPATRDLYAEYGKDLRKPVIAVLGNSVVVAYHDTVNKSLRVAKSIDGGATWVVQILESGYADSGDSISLVVVNNKLVMSYIRVLAFGANSQEELMYADSNDGGDSWSKKRVSREIRGYGYGTSVAMAVGEMAVACYDGTERNLVVMFSIDGGLSWRKTVADPAENTGRTPTLLTEGNIVRVVYSDWNTNSIKAASSYNGGASWVANELLPTANTSGVVAATAIPFFYAAYFSNQPGQAGAKVSKIQFLD